MDETSHANPAIDSACANCGAVADTAFCAACGQSAAIRHSLRGVARDAAASLWRGRIGRTLALLAWRPGELTRRYAAGERAKFLSPIAMFLTATALLFAAGSIVTPDFRMVPEGPRARTALAGDRARVGVQIERLEAQRDAAVLDKDWQEASALRRDLRVLRADMRRLDRVDRMLRRLDGGADDRAQALVRTGWPPLDQAVADAIAQPRLATYRVTASAYRWSWALIPATLPVLWLLFAWRRDVRLFDHAVFAVYSLGFMTLFAVALILLSAAGIAGGWLALAVILLPPIHVVRQFRAGYPIGWFGAAWRTAVLIAFAVVAIALFGLLIVAGT